MRTWRTLLLPNPGFAGRAWRAEIVKGGQGRCYCMVLTRAEVDSKHAGNQPHEAFKIITPPHLHLMN
jgi:hypothetical protein